MNDTAILFENVSKSYPLYHHIVGGFKHFLFNLPEAMRMLRHSNYEVLRNISFEVKKGETFGLIGRNGAGKSTTLGLIGGVLKPTRGGIKVDGKILPLLDLGAGLHPDLTGKENIVLKGVLLGHTRKVMQKKMEEICAFAELGKFIDEPVRIYSSGMVARLGFSVVACLEPEILLIDEILGVGDIDFRKKCFNKMMEFKKSGVTIVFVSHMLNDILRICNRVLWIENHGIRMIGKAEEVVEAYSKTSETAEKPKAPRSQVPAEALTAA